MPALPDDEAGKLAEATSAAIEALALAQFERLFQLIGDGMEGRAAIELVQQAFVGQFAERLAEAFTALLQRAIGVEEVRSMPVSGSPLSSRLYVHSIQTANEVFAIVRQHAQGLHEARALALQLYDGYDPKGAADRPLEGRARADLPAALRVLTEDAETRKSLQALIERGRAQAKRMRSAALRAAYTEAFDAWAAGRGDAVLRRKVDVAMREKNRYMANRIARTELARAHQAQVGADLMADESVEVVQVLLNPMHPVVDVCDLHAKADLYGLGAGCYPKEKAPQPPYHPHCWCKTRARRGLSGLVAREVEGGPAAWLRGLPVEDAARVMGSRERLQRVLDGEDVAAVLNGGKDSAYHLKRLGGGAGHALVRENAKMHAKEFSTWAETVLGVGYQPKHEYRRVGVLPSFVLEDKAVVALKPEGVDVHVSDMQLLHARRDTKASRGAALPVSVVVDLPGRLAGARWVFDESHDGVIAFFDAGVDGRVGKAVVHFNHVRKKVRYSAVLTMGLVQPENENARAYRALKPKA